MRVNCSSGHKTGHLCFRTSKTRPYHIHSRHSAWDVPFTINTHTSNTTILYFFLFCFVFLTSNRALIW